MHLCYNTEWRDWYSLSCIWYDLICVSFTRSYNTVSTATKCAVIIKNRAGTVTCCTLDDVIFLSSLFVINYFYTPTLERLSLTPPPSRGFSFLSSSRFPFVCFVCRLPTRAHSFFELQSKVTKKKVKGYSLTYNLVLTHIYIYTLSLLHFAL